MVCEPCPGILDFQDAVYGPITYDLVVALRDAYRLGRGTRHRLGDPLLGEAPSRGLPVPAISRISTGISSGWEPSGSSGVLGIFARLSFRDGKDGYLKDQPLVMSYLRRTCERYRELAALGRLLGELEQQEKRVGYTF
jgi:aminoglycoside/choline kinase family phosphotransferase